MDDYMEPGFLGFWLVYCSCVYCLPDIVVSAGLYISTWILVLESLVGKDTLRPILRRATWSLNLCLMGTRPPLPSPFTLTQRQEDLSRTSPTLKLRSWVTEIKGDWKWHVELWETFQHYWKSGAICFKCDAARIPRLASFWMWAVWVMFNVQMLILPLKQCSMFCHDLM